MCRKSIVASIAICLLAYILPQTSIAYEVNGKRCYANDYILDSQFYPPTKGWTGGWVSTCEKEDSSYFGTNKNCPKNYTPYATNTEWQRVCISSIQPSFPKVKNALCPKPWLPETGEKNCVLSEENSIKRPSVFNCRRGGTEDLTVVKIEDKTFMIGPMSCEQEGVTFSAKVICSITTTEALSEKDLNDCWLQESTELPVESPAKSVLPETTGDVPATN